MDVKEEPEGPGKGAAEGVQQPDAAVGTALPESDDASDEGRASSFPIVGIGASAGGLEALRRLFARLPSKSGMGYVLIQHLDPDRPSMLTQVLEGLADCDVVEAANGMPVVPDRLHVIPSGSDLCIHDGVLQLLDRHKTGGLHLPIDAFLKALAEDRRERAIGVILSGSGADGTEGLRAIKAAGGICLAQDAESAQFPSMPLSAAAAGVVDFRGPPERIAVELVHLGRHPYVVEERVGEARDSDAGDIRGLGTVLALVRQHAGLDFTGYKRTTLWRRTERRMALCHSASVEEYAQALREDAGEARLLAQDMLIHVTSFFRDGDAFEALKEQVFEEVVRRKSADDAVRIWVPGCSTGEEAYAVTICLLETLEGRQEIPPIKVFGSDLSDKAIETARLGRYAEDALAEVAPERLARYFERVEGGYRIVKRIRDLVVFVKHDLTRDPPFARLDLISCRNVLIYFDSELQRRVLAMLHYCLANQGFLFLGKSEAITGFRDLFAAVDKEHRIFIKTGESQRIASPMPLGRDAEVTASAAIPSERRQPAREAQVQADRLMLTRYAPPGVIVNDRLEIVQFRGRTGAYLEAPPGQPQSNVLRMARDGLAAHLHDALERARGQSSAVRKDGLRVDGGAESRLLNLEVTPLTPVSDASERYYLVVFEDAEPGHRTEPPPARPPRVEPAGSEAAEVERLSAELAATKDYLQSFLADHQISNDELAATNEELVAANEELQSTNEELQSAKEELQSTNEELGTVNDQLRSRNHELDEVAGDLFNVLTSVEIPVIIVDKQLRVRRFTPTVGQLARFIPEDVGRPIDDLKLKLQVNDLPARIVSVIAALTPREWEVQDLEGRWFRMQIRPYRTTDNRLEGAVLSFVDVDALKHAVNEAEAARDYAHSIVETVTSALVVLDARARVVSANAAFVDLLAVSGQPTSERSLFELGGGVFDEPRVHRALDGAIQAKTRFAGLELAVDVPRRGPLVLSLTGQPIARASGDLLLLLAIDDITSVRALEAERGQLLASERNSRIEAERANRAKDLFLATLSHELRTPLSTILMSAQLLRRLGTGDPRIGRASAAIERSAGAQSRLIDDLLDVSRIVSGKLLLDLGPVDIATVVQEAVDIARLSAQAKALELVARIDLEVGIVYGDAARLLQIVNNLLTNAIKFTPHGGHIAVRLEHDGEQARLTVTDTGIGIRPDVLPHLFSRFVQADSSVTRTHGGLGLGLSIVRHLAEAHGGRVWAESPGEGQGATFTVTLPMGSGRGVSMAPARRETTSDISGIRVLLLEDDVDTRQSCRAMLEELGAQVRDVATAAEALAALDEFHPRVILSDIAMPIEDGFTFIRKVRARSPERGGRIPAAALTALASDEDRRQALESGFQLHLAKPVDSARLASAVATLAAGSSPQ